MNRIVSHWIEISHKRQKVEEENTHKFERSERKREEKERGNTQTRRTFVGGHSARAVGSFRCALNRCGIQSGTIRSCHRPTQPIHDTTITNEAKQIKINTKRRRREKDEDEEEREEEETVFHFRKTSEIIPTGQGRPTALR